MLEAVYNSRKFRMGLITMGLIVFSSLLVFINPIFTTIYSTIAGSFVTTYGIYCGMNVANKWALGKAQGATVETLETAEANQDSLPEVKFPEDK